jgi:hypothetical protein
LCSLLGENDSLLGENDSQVGENESLLGENDLDLAENESLLEQMWPVLEENDPVLEENDSQVEENDARASRLDAASTEPWRARYTRGRHHGMFTDALRYRPSAPVNLRAGGDLMYSTSTRSNITHENGSREFLPNAEVGKLRVRTQETAQRLSLVAIRNWEKAITGVIALPAAAALTAAAGVLFATSLIEHGFEMFELALSDVGRRVTDDFDAHGEPRVDVAARASSPS